ncbi:MULTISPECIES: pilin [unclassified Polaromonas]|uniref:pilin n=1 Tax=unclassified Polaromonas TaxID=2638319 RepID=UPI0013DDD864|nr:MULTISPECIES: pilin [unclassified Polaromonas]
MDFRKVKFPDLKSWSLVDVAVLLSLAVLVVTHLPAAFESHRVRQQVAAVLPLAANAQALVDSNALKGVAFDAAWAPIVLKNQAAAVEIAAPTGIITLTFAEIGGGGKSLKLIPMMQADAGLLPLAQAGKAVAASSRKIIWVCTSSLTRSRDPYVMANKGTLESKYAPDACRHRAAGANKL